MRRRHRAVRLLGAVVVVALLAGCADASAVTIAPTSPRLTARAADLLVQLADLPAGYSLYADRGLGLEDLRKGATDDTIRRLLDDGAFVSAQTRHFVEATTNAAAIDASLVVWDSARAAHAALDALARAALEAGYTEIAPGKPLGYETRAFWADPSVGPDYATILVLVRYANAISLVQLTGHRELVGIDTARDVTRKQIYRERAEIEAAASSDKTERLLSQLGR
jgi:hypothetical protein